MAEEGHGTAPLRIGSYRNPGTGDVVSHLNITTAMTKYGGVYECRASSKVGSVSHSEPLNIKGAPFVRSMDPAKVGVDMHSSPMQGGSVSKCLVNHEDT